MATPWFVCALVLVSAELVSGSDDEVPFTPVCNAVERRAVCLDGSPAGYHHAAGSGGGADNWIVYLKGGGWCPNNDACQKSTTKEIGSTRSLTSTNLTGILSKRPNINPDFYNWNRIYVIYCDQSSFLGDTDIDGPGPKLRFRGSRIFEAVIEDLLAKGMSNANNAILAGRSAGGLAAILHCDGFRARLPNAARVKCISDAGFFIRAKNLPNANYRERFFASTITFHNISSFLPTSCTKKLDPNLCLFPENLVGEVQTPLFLLNSAFDFYQIQNLLVPHESPNWGRWKKCLFDLSKCPAAIDQIKEFGGTFLEEIRAIDDKPSRGFFIHPCLTHTVSMYPADKLWTPNSSLTLGNNMTMVQAVGDWYFDRASVRLITSAISPEFCK